MSEFTFIGTTRKPRPKEKNGVDYTFLSMEEFLHLEKDGKLLESGVYGGKIHVQCTIYSHFYFVI